MCVCQGKADLIGDVESCLRYYISSRISVARNMKTLVNMEKIRMVVY